MAGRSSRSAAVVLYGSPAAGNGEQVPIPYRGIAIPFVCSSILQKNGSVKHPRISSSRI